MRTSPDVAVRRLQAFPLALHSEIVESLDFLINEDTLGTGVTCEIHVAEQVEGAPTDAIEVATEVATEVSPGTLLIDFIENAAEADIDAWAAENDSPSLYAGLKLLALREEDFTTAAVLMGAKPARVIGRHLIPNFMSHLIASATLSIPSMILGETALSFLGLGLRPPITSWGVLLVEAQNINVVALYPWLMLPVVPVILTILAFNFLGDGLRDAADPYKSG